MNVVIVGGGKKVNFLVRALLKKKYKVSIINRNPMECRYLAHEHEATVIEGDGSKRFILEDTNIQKADLMIALTPKDADNLIICQLAKRFFQVKRVFAIVNDPRNVALFKQLGVDTVISATYTMASILEQMASVEQLVHAVSLDDGKIQLVELSIPTGSPACGKTLAELPFPQNSIIGCIVRGSNAFIPHGDHHICAGDKVAILTTSDTNDEIVRVLVGSLKK